MKNNKFAFLLAVSSCFLMSADGLIAQRTTEESRRKIESSNDQKTRFIRLRKDVAGTPQALQTSVTRFQSPDGKLLVDLIGVIHVGDEKYYRKLNRQFQVYDSLLYELVAPPESRVPTRQAKRSNSNPVHWLQNSMQSMLGLESQLQHIDYTKSNFVHADLSPGQMQRKIAERGDTAWSLGFRALSEMMKKANSVDGSGTMEFSEKVASFEDLFGLLNDPRKLKIMMATQFASSESLEAGLGATLNELLIDDRNKAAVEVLRKEIDKGQKKLGIFYGAAHMPDFEKRLIRDLGLKKTKHAWVDAWDLQATGRAASPSATMADMLFQLLDSIDQ